MSETRDNVIFGDLRDPRGSGVTRVARAGHHVLGVVYFAPSPFTGAG